MSYEIRFSKQAKKDVAELTKKLQDKLRKLLLTVIVVDPYSGKKLVGELKGSYSMRLTLKDRVVYSIDEKSKTIFIERAKTHYGE